LTVFVVVVVRDTALAILLKEDETVLCWPRELHEQA